jgi:hypothetical protein
MIKMEYINLKVPIFFNHKSQAKLSEKLNNKPITINNVPIGVIKNDGNAYIWGRYMRAVVEYDDKIDVSGMYLDINTTLKQLPDVVIELNDENPMKNIKTSSIPTKKESNTEGDK